VEQCLLSSCEQSLIDALLACCCNLARPRPLRIIHSTDEEIAESSLAQTRTQVRTARTLGVDASAFCVCVLEQCLVSLEAIVSLFALRASCCCSRLDQDRSGLSVPMIGRPRGQVLLKLEPRCVRRKLLVSMRVLLACFGTVSLELVARVSLFALIACCCNRLDLDCSGPSMSMMGRPRGQVLLTLEVARNPPLDRQGGHVWKTVGHCHHQLRSPLLNRLGVDQVWQTFRLYMMSLGLVVIGSTETVPDHPCQ
jgi:hypothetical protein